MGRVQASQSAATGLPAGVQVQRTDMAVLQLNIGRYCNLACVHCHVESSPKRSEAMTGEVRERIIDWIRVHRPPLVDITGGAPELIAGFRELVAAARDAGCEVMDRCNLAVLTEPGQEDLAEFLAGRRVHMVASLPCYLADNVDRQRGRGVYDRSIQGLKILNAHGYGIRPELPLHLVYNPLGPELPPRQEALEPAYRERLRSDWGIEFTGLWCLANVPVTRFRRRLGHTGELQAYEKLLRDSFNPGTLDRLMCRTTVSVDHEGRLFDCDFNLAVDLPMGGFSGRRRLWEIAPEDLTGRSVAMRDHCLACTAGCGSSCNGAVAG